ncbi:MAG: diaminopimelate decarboxylase [Desulfatiglans sp.]|jgi:diaminopimelate decarboxylase|nr:diaminopimelate decarboxylase [Desulfatiglans sp.]
MHFFEYKNRELYCEDVRISDIAKDVKTPFYLYSHATLERHFRAFNDAFNGIDHITCFSMKSNSNMAILKLFSNAGGGVDIVSGGELYRAINAGVSPEKIVYSGVGKTAEEMEYALTSGILMFNSESPQEIEKLDEVAGRLNKKAKIAIRVNPDVDPQTHPYISTGLKENKFGIDINSSYDEYLRANRMTNLEVAGVSCHIGSQLTKVSPFVDALKKLKDLIMRLTESGINIRYLDLGGGLGITYNDEKPPMPHEYASALKETIGDMNLTLILEPGRVIVGNSGILVAKVLYTKKNQEKNFSVVDAAMNDLARPSLYGSYHGIRPVKIDSEEIISMDIVGPICESGDFLAKNREIPALKQGDLIAVMSAGAYGFSMSSSYNSRPKVAEIMVKGDTYYTVRERETYEDLIRGETIPDFLK